MDKLYIDKNNKAITIDLPLYGEVRLLVKDGKVVKSETITAELLEENAPKKVV
ncbi:hypothetical protein M2139_000310 [Enterococcus sp. PF1-24]|uniref:hypothetical protein n=1 Tax=unclassified Enterococcus TaxID=2608891 RepID=UPI0024768B19|nr:MULTISPECIES: hypothetical protein [unclassified Enterococcus]MDH6363270.1 hypothetical protein [Enterococcus sp. PFB1-1]MDH6400429.1 hypothetical protein [Enterococcus sp. PF1-24]